MAAHSLKQLHWAQRVALVRHNLHSASRSGNFCFFKTLQACVIMEGTNHAATLSAILEGDKDATQVALDNINASLALAYQESFEKVYDNVKSRLAKEDSQRARSELCSDIASRKDANDVAIDRLVNSAIALIDESMPETQEYATNAWITGVTIIADSIEVTLQEMQALDLKLDDLIGMEESWNTVKASVILAITGIKGIFSLMDPSLSQNEKAPRKMSITSVTGSIIRRFSNAFQSPGNPETYNVSAPSSPTSPISFPKPTYQTPNCSRKDVFPGLPISLPSQGNINVHELSTPPVSGSDEQTGPFDTSRVISFPDLAASPINMEQRAVKRTVAL